jgi:glycosyltransferase involved in cell wall biosynthesis
MRIVVDATAAMSGGKVYLTHLLPKLVQMASSHELIVLHNGDVDGLSELPTDARLHLHRVAGLAASNSVWLGKAIIKLCWRLFVFPLYLRRWQPDVLFSNAGFAPGWQPRRTKLVIALHNSMPLRAELIAEEHSLLRRWRLRLLRRLMGQAVRRSAATIVFSHDTQRRVQAAFGGTPEKLTVIHHGIDWGAAERAQDCSAQFLQQLGLTQPYLLYVSQFHRYKNLTTLLDAFALIWRRHPQLKLALVGDLADAEYWRECAAQIARLDLAERVVCLPACERAQLLQLYRGALAFVHPSLAETCSFPLLEAMAMGVPIAAARMSALPEIAGEAAIYFDPYDERELADVLEQLIVDEELRATLRNRAIERSERFAWEAAARATLKLLETIGGAPHNGA